MAKLPRSTFVATAQIQLIVAIVQTVTFCLMEIAHHAQSDVLNVITTLCV
jgi:hypothetical protein